MLREYLRHIFEPQPLEDISVLERNYCYFLSGFAHLRIQHSGLVRGAYIQECGPGTILPPIGHINRGDMHLQLDMVGGCEVITFPPKTSIQLFEKREALHQDLIRIASSMMSSQGILANIASMPKHKRLASLIYHYYHTPLWKPESAFISLPPAPHLSQILDLQPSELRRDLLDLKRNLLIHDYDFAADTEATRKPCMILVNGRINIQVTDMAGLKQIVNEEERHVSILTAGSGLDLFCKHLEDFMLFKRDHFDSVVDALNLLYKRINAYDIIILGRDFRPPAHELLMAEIMSGNPAIHWLAPRIMAYTPESQSMEVQEALGYDHTITSLEFNDISANDFILKAFQCLSAKVRRDISPHRKNPDRGKIIQLSMYAKNTP